MAGKYRLGKFKVKAGAATPRGTVSGAGIYKASRYKSGKILDILRAKSGRKKQIFAAFSPKGALLGVARKGRLVTGKTSKKVAAVIRKKLGIRRRKTNRKRACLRVEIDAAAIPLSDAAARWLDAEAGAVSGGGGGHGVLSTERDSVSMLQPSQTAI